jgi:hypothetical protein
MRAVLILTSVLLFALGQAGPTAAASAPARHAPTPGASTRRAATPGRAAATPVAKPNAAPRTLDDIHIEGEIPVPQVLFITARDQRRFLEFRHRRYLPTSRELGAGAAMPSQVRVTRGTTPFEKEIGR